MKKIFLGLLSMFVLIGMSWAGVKVSGLVAANGNNYPTGAVVKLVPQTGETQTVTIGSEHMSAAGARYLFTNVENGDYTIKVEHRDGTKYCYKEQSITVEDATIIAGKDSVEVDKIDAPASLEKCYLRVETKEGQYTNLAGVLVKIWKSGEENADTTTVTTAKASEYGSAEAYILMTYEADAEYTLKATKADYKTALLTGQKVGTMTTTTPEGGGESVSVLNGTEITMTMEKDLGNVVTLSCTLKQGETTLTAFPSELTYGKVVCTDKFGTEHYASSFTDGKLVFTEVPVGAVTFKLMTNQNAEAKSWGVVAASNAAISGADGATVSHDLVLERIAAMVSGKILLNGTAIQAQIYGESGTGDNKKTTANVSPNTQGEYVLYGLTAGAWTLKATAQGYTIPDLNVTIANASDDKTDQNFTPVVADMDMTYTFAASASINNENIQMWGAKVTLTKNGAAYGDAAGYTLPAAEDKANGIYTATLTVTGLKAKMGDSIFATFDHPDYNPVTVKTKVSSSSPYIAATNGWVKRTVPATKPALKVKNPAATYANNAVNLTWDYPAALFNGTAWADGYKIQKITIYKINFAEGATSQTTLASWPQSAQNELTVANLPKQATDADAQENGYYSYRFELRYELPTGGITDTTIVYGAPLLKVNDLALAFAKVNNKNVVTVTWDYPAALQSGWNTTYKVQRIELKRRDLTTAAQDTTLWYQNVKNNNEYAAFTTLAKSFKDSANVKADGVYGYTLAIRYDKPSGTASEVAYLDLSPKAPVNAVAVWNESNQRMDLTWGYPASLRANWTSMKTQRFEIERKDNSTSAVSTTVFYKNIEADDTFDSLPVAFSDKTAQKTGNYTYTLRLRFREAGVAETKVMPAVRAHKAIDLDAVWVAGTDAQEAGVQLSWNYPTELINGLGTTYKMQRMSVERRDMATATDMNTLMVWSKEQLGVAADLPKEYFDATAESTGNYNYIVRIRYEEPAATVETVKNLNMALYAVEKDSAYRTGTYHDTMAVVKLQWDYPTQVKNGLGGAYKLRKLEINRRDLSTAYGMTLVKYFDLSNVTAAANLPLTCNDTVKNYGNYAYIFTLVYDEGGQREKTFKLDLRANAYLTLSVNDATLGEIIGTPAGTYKSGDLVSLKAQVKEGADAHFKQWSTLKRTGSGTFDYVKVDGAEAEYSFILPAGSVILRADFEKNSVAPTVSALPLDKPAATWNAGTKRVDLTWDYPQAVKDGFGTDYKIQKIDLLRNDNAQGSASQVQVGNFNSFTTVENLPKSWYDTTAEAGKSYTYIFRIRYVDLGTKDTTAQVTIPVAVEVNELAATRIYPNPANGEFNVVVPVAAKMEIFAANGVLVKAEKVAANRKVAIRESGIYFVRLTTASGAVLVKRVVVR